jgi:hypothetical protein
LYEHGCVVIRGLISQEDINHCTTVTERTFDICNGMLNVLEVPHDELLEAIQDLRLRKFVSNIRIGQIESQYFENLNAGASIYDVLLKNKKRHDFILSILGREWFKGAGIIRRVSPAKKKKGDALSQCPIRMHCDGPTLSRHTYAVNFWVPLADCQGESPGIQLVPGPFESMQSAVKHDWKTSTVDHKIEMEMQILYSRGEDGNPRFIPSLKRGDVVVFHNWIMHATHSTAKMTKPRSSLELRFNAPDRTDFEAFAGTAQ